MAKNEKQEYPEHEKVQAVKNESQAIGEFIDWLHTNEMEIADMHDEPPYLLPVRKSISTLLAEYFKIDSVKLEKEKQEMLKKIRQQNEKQI